MYLTICVNYEAKIAAGAGTGAGTGAYPKWRLRLQPNTPAPAPKPCLRVTLYCGFYFVYVSIGIVDK